MTDTAAEKLRALLTRLGPNGNQYASVRVGLLRELLDERDALADNQQAALATLLKRNLGNAYATGWHDGIGSVRMPGWAEREESWRRFWAELEPLLVPTPAEGAASNAAIAECRGDERCTGRVPAEVASAARVSRHTRCALSAGHADPTHDDGHGLSWQGAPFPPGIGDGSTRDQIERFLTDDGRRMVAEFFAASADESDDFDIDEVIARNHADAMRDWFGDGSGETSGPSVPQEGA